MTPWLDRLLPGEGEWLRPVGLVALLLPLVVLLASFRPARPEPRFSGAFILWRNARSGATGERSRPDVPLARALWILSLLLGALALGRPEPKPPEQVERLLLVMDGSPSMELSHPGGGTRRRAVVRRLEEWLEERGPVRLQLLDGRPLEGAEDLEELDSGPVENWGPFDAEGVLWLTDQAPSTGPEVAGLIACGGDAVPGPIAARGADRWWWDGERTEWRLDSGAGGELRLVGRIPGPVAELARLWAEERGWEILEGAEDGFGSGPSLCLVGAQGLPGSPRFAGRDGWRAQVRPLVGALPGAPGGRSWLEDLVLAQSGRIELRLGSMLAPEGDPAAFVNSWAELFDNSVRAPGDVVSRSERRSAGDEAFRAPSPQEVPHQGPVPGPSWTARLAAGAAILGALALAMSGLGRGL